MGERIERLLRDDALRWGALQTLAQLALPDGWIAAGFLRNAVWDALHGVAPRPPVGDVDIIWFDPQQPDPARDRALEAVLRDGCPALRWSVKNQARMHRRNGDRPYASAIDAMRCWPETATAVAARIAGDGRLEIAAPYGLQDLFALRLRPTPRFASDRAPVFAQRVADKGWLRRYPLLRLCREP